MNGFKNWSVIPARTWRIRQADEGDGWLKIPAIPIPVGELTPAEDQKEAVQPAPAKAPEAPVEEPVTVLPKTEEVIESVEAPKAEETIEETEEPKAEVTIEEAVEPEVEETVEEAVEPEAEVTVEEAVEPEAEETAVEAEQPASVHPPLLRHKISDRFLFAASCSEKKKKENTQCQ